MKVNKTISFTLLLVSCLMCSLFLNFIVCSKQMLENAYISMLWQFKTMLQRQNAFGFAVNINESAKTCVNYIVSVGHNILTEHVCL